MRPDRAHLYIYGDGEVRKITVDPDFPDAWKSGKGAEIVQRVLQKSHAVVVIDKQLNFLNGIDKVQPEKLLIDWLL